MIKTGQALKAEPHFRRTLYTQEVAHNLLPLVATGRPVQLRELLWLVFTAIVNEYFGGNMEALRLSVQFKESQVRETRCMVN